MEKMMVIVPIDRHIGEAQHIGRKARRHAAQRRPVGAMRYLQFKHHDGDDDRDDAVAERGETIFAHGAVQCLSLAEINTANSRKVQKAQMDCTGRSHQLPSAATIARATSASMASRWS